MISWQNLSHQLSLSVGEKVYPQAKPVSGGGISKTWQVPTESAFIFVKTDMHSGLLEAEAKGLTLLGASETIRVPSVLAFGHVAESSYLATEWLDFIPSYKNSQRVLGRQLARLHMTEHDNFGLCDDNFIGRTLQKNIWEACWPDFYRDYRLLPQLRLAQENGFNGKLQELGYRLCEHMDAFFDEQAIQVSLLHGDLWGGNWGTVASGEPVIFDPAVYWGHREADLAMTELFGGFSQEFYQAYQETWPTDDAYLLRRHLYNLYHILNHLNLFGSGYYEQALGLIRRLLKNV